MDLDLSRAGGMSRLLRQGKASEHIIDWTGLRWVIMPFPYEVQRSLAVAVAHSGTSPHVPTYKQAKRAASECDYACFGAQRTPPSGPARSVTIGTAKSSAGEREVGQWALMQLHDAKKRL